MTYAMHITPELIDRIKIDYRTLRTSEIAGQLLVKPATLRQALSRYGITDPKRTASEQINATIRKLWNRGTPAEIAEYLDLPTYIVRSRARRMFTRPGVQLTLFPVDQYTVDAPPMRVIIRGLARRV